MVPKKLIGKSTSASTYTKAADFLDGQKLVRFVLLPKKCRCVFEFDLGGRLETRPYDRHSEQWLFFDKRIHTVLTLRADGNYSYGLSNRPDPQKVEADTDSLSCSLQPLCLFMLPLRLLF